jgi:hypothetical protein
MIEVDVRKWLLDQTALSAIVGLSIFHSTVPQTGSFPAIVMPSKHDGEEAQNDYPVDHTTFTFSCCVEGTDETECYIRAHELAEQLQDTLKTLHGTIGDSTVYAVSIKTQEDRTFVYYVGQSEGLQVVDVTASIYHNP